jgi:hypothetical protein
MGGATKRIEDKELFELSRIASAACSWNTTDWQCRRPNSQPQSVQNTSLGISTYRKILEAKKRLRRLEPLVLSREKNMCQRLCRREVYIMLSSTRKGNVCRRSYKNT